MKDETKYFGRVMKKYSRKDTIEWIIGVVLCMAAIPFIYVNIFVCIALSMAGVATLAYNAGKDSVSLRMMNEDLTEDDKRKILQKQHNVW